MTDKIRFPPEGDKQIVSQTKNILEIAGQQITGKQDGVNIGETQKSQMSAVNQNNFTVQGQQIYTEDALDTKTILQIIENLCTRLVHNGDDYILMTTNPFKQTFDYIGSDRGREFIKHNLQLLHDFVKHCYDSSLSESHDHEKMHDESCITKKVSNHMAEILIMDEQNGVPDFHETESNEFEKNEEDNGNEMDAIVQNSELGAFSIATEGFSTESPQELKAYPHPKKRLAKLNPTKPKADDILKENSVTKDKKQTTLSNICNECDKSFSSQSLLIRHKRINHKTHALVNTNHIKKCNVCDKSFQSNEDINSHNCIQEERQTAIQCQHCSKTFGNANSYRSHLIFHEKPQHTCSNCDKKFYLKKSLIKHRQLHKNKFKCKSCSTEFTNKENYELHSCERDDPSNFTQTYKSRVTDDGKHECGICKKVFNKRRGLLTHRKLHSTIYASNHVCEICNKCYGTRNSLRKHIKVVHSDSRNFVCDTCGKTFKQQDTLNAHMKVHDDNRTEFQCKECGKFLLAQASLNVHMRTHQKLKPYICDVCGVAFSQRGNLAKHMTSHSDSTNFSCKLCGKEFKYHQTWKTHMRSHALKAGLNDLEVLAYGKFYVCEICEKKVASASQFKVHMRTHTNERPYACSQCNKCFKESGKLSRHMRTHKPISHQEHNYTWEGDDKMGKEKNTTQYVNIAMKPNFTSSHNLAHNSPGSLMVSNTRIDNNDQNAGFMSNISYADHSSNDTNTTLDKTITEAHSNVDQMRVIDDSRHQFLMHQLAPVTNSIMESPESQRIQIPSSSSMEELHVMQVGFVEECQVTNENHHTEYSVVTNQDMMAGSNNSFPYHKYFHRD